MFKVFELGLHPSKPEKSLEV